MKLATVLLDGGPKVGLVNDGLETFIPFADSMGAAARDMLAFIATHKELEFETLLPVPLSEAVLLAPIPRPRRNIFCVGKNYREHAREFTASGFDSTAANAGDAVPKFPIIFTKVPECVIGPDQPILYPAGISEQVDYEAELAVIIGGKGRGISRADALSHIFGYTALNDVTARDLQARHKQWVIGKSLDSFCPMGPWIVTADAIDASGLDIACWVNDEQRQKANTADLIFDIPGLIETISAGITLYPGDIIATGTPAGVGIGFNPPRFLRPGDAVRVKISGIGELKNVVA